MGYIDPIGEDRWARVDMSDVRRRQARHVHVPGWFGAYTWALRHSDYEAAELIRSLNDPKWEAEQLAKLAQMITEPSELEQLIGRVA